MSEFHRSLIPSLETRWLSRHHKWVRQPEVFICDGLAEGYSGFYCDPSETPLRYSGNEFYVPNGGIFVGFGGAPSTLAHEWRHHWQLTGDYEYDGKGWTQQSSPQGYRDAIVRYFSESRCEMDALLFEHQHAPDDKTTRWLEWLRP